MRNPEVLRTIRDSGTLSAISCVSVEFQYAFNRRTAPKTDRIIKLREAAAIRDVSVDTLRRMGARGDIRILKLSPRRRGVLA